MPALILALACSTVPLQAPVAGLRRWEGVVRQVAGTRWRDRGAQLLAESGGNQYAQSWVADKSGRKVPCASGLMQFTEPTWQAAIRQGWVLAGDRPTDPEPAVRAGHAYMNQLEARFHGNWNAALGGYNAGPGSVSKAVRLAEQLGIPGQDGWLVALERVTGTNRLTGRPHAEETRGYVRRTNQLRAELLRQRPASE